MREAEQLAAVDISEWLLPTWGPQGGVRGVMSSVIIGLLLYVHCMILSDAQLQHVSSRRDYPAMLL